MGWGMDAQVILGSLFEAQVFTGVAQEDCYVRKDVAVTYSLNLILPKEDTIEA